MQYITVSRSDRTVNNQCQQSNHIAIWTSAAASEIQNCNGSRTVTQKALEMVPDRTV